MGRGNRRLGIRVGSVATVVAVLSAALAISGCGAFKMTTESGWSYGLVAKPGQLADTTAVLVNDGPLPVTLESATLVPLPGFPAPRLAHVAVLVHSHDLISAAGWPLRGTSYAPTWAFHGHVLRPGQRTDLVYSIQATRLGNYGAYGLKVVVSAQTSLGIRKTTATAYGATGLCVQRELKACSGGVSQTVLQAANTVAGLN